MKASELRNHIENGQADARLVRLYGRDKLEAKRRRFVEAIDAFTALYGDAADTALFSVPGRSEISGNHTDHNHGRVLAAAVDPDVIAVAAKRDTGCIRIKSRGFDEDKIDITVLSPDAYEKYTSASLIAGICAAFRDKGYGCGAFDAYTDSTVKPGSGLSSSAAFEVMIAEIQNEFYADGQVSAPEMAKAAQYAENVFFGKPCGLMDQTACAVGGFVAIDFDDPTAPVIEKLPFELSSFRYSLCITAPGGNHANLNDDYAAIPAEMKAVASYFGRPVLRGLSYEDITGNLAELREKCGDRAVLRALHFIDENERVARQTEALRSIGGQPDSLNSEYFDLFLDGVESSGDSSYKLLQNIYSPKDPASQGLSLALALSSRMFGSFKRRAVCRVHGGGFAGTIQAFIPNEYTGLYRETMDAAFGHGSCAVLSVRPDGAIRVI